MTRVRDPNGVELFPTLLHVLEKDECDRVTLCRVRYGDDMVKLDGVDTRKNQFLLVWAPVSSLLDADQLFADFAVVKRTAAELHEQVVAVKRDIARVSSENERLQGECAEKAATVRTLVKERDPERLERRVQERTVVVTGELESLRSSSAATIAALQSQVAELRASKKKLREALERAKEGKR